MSAEECEEVRGLLQRHRLGLLRELEESQLVPVLVKKGVLNVVDEEVINAEVNVDRKCDGVIEAIARKGFHKFKEFCYAVETECPQFITDIINDRLNYAYLTPMLIDFTMR
uniref:Uncharacterized protein n=1 Tax=Phlebotomus papatasi TaxID=29031 RepID=A0A1B0GNT1_PHLPP